MHDLASNSGHSGAAGEEVGRYESVRSRAAEALLSLLRSADLAKHRFAGIFESEGITFQQYNVLRILRRAGPRGLPTLEVGECMIERTPGVTRIIDRLEAKGLVDRERGTRDRRRVWCKISPAGLALLLRLDGPVNRTDEGIFASMDEEELEAFIETMERLHARLASGQ